MMAEPSPASRVEVWTFRLIAGAMPLVAVISPLGMAPLLAIAAVLLLCGYRKRFSLTALPRSLVLVLAAVGLWGLAGAPWAVDPAHSARVAATFIAIAVGGTALIASGRALPPIEVRRCGLILMAGLALAFLFFAEEALTCGKVATLRGVPYFCESFFFIYKRGITTAVLLLWLAAWLVWRGGSGRPALVATAAVAALALWVVAWYGAGTAKLAMAVGATVFVLALPWGGKMARGLAVLFIVGVALAPFAAGRLPPPDRVWEEMPFLPTSLHHRLTIWRFVAERWTERPVMGWGMDASRSLPGAEEVIVTEVTRPNGQVYRAIEQVLPLHPHSTILQWWLELGVPGGVLLALLAWTAFGAMARIAARPDRAFALAATASGLCVLLASYGAWQSWWLSSIWLMAALGAAACGSKGKS